MQMHNAAAALERTPLALPGTIHEWILIIMILMSLPSSPLSSLPLPLRLHPLRLHNEYSDISWEKLRINRFKLSGSDPLINNV